MGISAARIMNGSTQRAVIACSSNGSNEIVAAVAGRAIVVTSFLMVGASAVNAKFTSAATDLMGAMPIGTALGGIYNPAGHVETAVGEALNLNLSSGVAVSGFINYVTYVP